MLGHIQDECQSVSLVIYPMNDFDISYYNIHALVQDWYLQCISNGDTAVLH